MRSPFAIGTHSDQYYDAPKKSPKGSARAQGLWGIQSREFFKLSHPAMFKEYIQGVRLMKYLQIRVISDQYEKEIKSRKENSQLGSRQPLASVGGSGVLFPSAPLYIPNIYIYSILYSMLCLTHVCLHYIAFQIPHPYTRSTYYISPEWYARSWHLLSEW